MFVDINVAERTQWKDKYKIELSANTMAFISCRSSVDRGALKVDEGKEEWQYSAILLNLNTLGYARGGWTAEQFKKKCFCLPRLEPGSPAGNQALKYRWKNQKNHT